MGFLDDALQPHDDTTTPSEPAIERAPAPAVLTSRSG